MTLSPLDAVDLVTRAEALEHKIAAARVELAKRPEMADEVAWLETARARIAKAREPIGNLLTRVLRLPELEPIREERRLEFQGAVLDAVDRIDTDIRIAGGPRSPLLEALYTNLKLQPLRRAARGPFETFCDEFERRLGTSYLTRMLASEGYAAVMPAVDQFRRTLAEWRELFSSPPLAEAEASALAAELTVTAERLDVPCRQALFLAEAALLDVPELRQSSAIFDKPKKRPARRS